MTQPHVARLFRSPELGRLATLAAAQGWDVSRLPGGHVAATNPRSGARVLMSGTGYVNRGTLRAKVHEFVQAGLDPDWTRKADRARQRQEAPPMQVHDVEVPTPAPITPEAVTDTVRRPGAHLTQGGRFAFLGPREVLDVGGFHVKVGERADGLWIGTTRDLDRKRRVRQWNGRSRDRLLAAVAADIAANPPRAAAEAPEAAPQEAEDPALAALADAAVILSNAAAERIRAEDAPAPVQALSPSSFHVVQADPAEFPLAAALDALDAAMAPALVALEAAGRQDAASLLRGEVTRTPVEAELLALYRRVLRGE